MTSFEVRRQFVDGNTVCSIIDWEMAMPGLGRMTSAELLEVEDGVIVRGELIYDAEALRRAMATERRMTRGSAQLLHAARQSGDGDAFAGAGGVAAG